MKMAPQTRCEPRPDDVLLPGPVTVREGVFMAFDHDWNTRKHVMEARDDSEFTFTFSVYFTVPTPLAKKLLMEFIGEAAAKSE